MKRLPLVFIILLILLAPMACEQPTATETVTEVVYVTEEPPPEEPAWQPEPWHIYILNSVDTILFDYETFTLNEYYYMLQAVKLKIDLHNRDFEEIWHWVAGGMS